MAITISGENNNDRILAADGVIDQISGINIVGLITASHINVGSNIQLGNAGIITATTFVGNVTGNVNSTSPLLLQTGGSERFRITGNNELGIAGANYGSAGQVLTSGGSGSAVSWATIPTQVTITGNADNRVITGGSGVNLNGEANLTFSGSTLKVNSTTGHAYLKLNSNDSYSGTIHFGDQSNDDAAQIWYDNYQGNGMYFRTSENTPMQFYTNSNPRLSINGNGSIQITPEGSTSNPYMLIDTSGDSVRFSAKKASGNNEFRFLTQSSGSVSEALRITSDGKVGVGDFSSGTAVSQALHVKGSAPEIYLEHTGGYDMTLTTSDGAGHNGITVNGGALSLAYNNKNIWMCRTGGYVAVGHMSPATRLDVKQDNGVAYNGNSQSVAYNAARFFNTSGHTGGGAYTGFQFNITGDSQNRVCSIGMITEASNSKASSLVFHTDDNGNRTEKLRITSSGELKVSTSKASGYVAEFNQTNTSNSAQIKINSPTDSNSRPCLIDFTRAGTIKWSAGMGYNDTYNGFHISAGSLSANTSNSKFVITSDGYTGIGNYAGAATDPVVSLLQVTTNWDNGGVPMVHFKGANNEAPTNGNSGGNISFQISDENDNVLHKVWNTGGGNTDLGKVYYAGKFGIGDTDPAALLTVNNGTNDAQFVQMKNDNVGLFFGAYGNGATYDREATINGSRVDAGSSPYLRVAGQGGIKFCADLNSEKVRIATNGVVHVNSVGGGQAVIAFGNPDGNSFQAQNRIGGDTIFVADESISSAISMPRQGCFVIITAFSDTSGIYPQPNTSCIAYVDCGASRNIRICDLGTGVGTAVAAKNAYTSNVSECDNNKLTIMAGDTQGTFRLVNRESNNDYYYQISFL